MRLADGSVWCGFDPQFEYVDGSGSLGRRRFYGHDPRGYRTQPPLPGSLAHHSSNRPYVALGSLPWRTPNSTLMFCAPGRS